MNEELTKKLFNRFNFYKPERPISEGLMGFGFGCGDGWFNLIWKLSEDIENELKSEDNRTQIKQRLKDDPPFEVVQVKEKFGELRFYANGGTSKIQDLINEAEGKSATICEICGRPGETRGEGWITTLCDDCYNKQE